MFKRFLIALAAILTFGTATAEAQISIPNSFVTHQVISSSKMNSNFNQLGLLALNRQAPVLQATLVGDTTAAYDLGAVATTFRNAYLSGQLNAATAAFTGLATFSSSQNASYQAIEVANPNAGVSADVTLRFDNASTNAAWITLYGASHATKPNILEINNRSNAAINFLTNATLAAVITSGGALQFPTNGSFPAGGGAILKHSNDGLSIAAATGVAFDFALTNPSGASGIITVPTGTLNISTGGNITVNGNASQFGVSANGFAYTRFDNQNVGASAYSGIIVSAHGNSFAMRMSGDGVGSNFLEWDSDALGAVNPLMRLTTGGALSLVVNTTHTFGQGTTGATSSVININGGSANGNGAYLIFSRNSVNQSQLGNASVLLGTNSNDMALVGLTGNGIGFYTNGNTSMRWGINSAGDFTVGTAQHITESSGTPTCGAGCSISGTDFAFVATLTAGTTGATITFGHAMTNSVCVASSPGTAASVSVASLTTTGFALNISANGGGAAIPVLCRGF